MLFYWSTTATAAPLNTQPHETNAATNAATTVHLQCVEEEQKAEEVVQVAVPVLFRVRERGVVLAHPRKPEHTPEARNLANRNNTGTVQVMRGVRGEEDATQAKRERCMASVSQPTK